MIFINWKRIGKKVLIPASLFLLILLVCLFFILCEGWGQEKSLLLQCQLQTVLACWAAQGCFWPVWRKAKCGQEDYCCMLPEYVGCPRFRLYPHCYSRSIPSCSLLLGSAHTLGLLTFNASSHALTNASFLFEVWQSAVSFILGC